MILNLHDSFADTSTQKITYERIYKSEKAIKNKISTKTKCRSVGKIKKMRFYAGLKLRRLIK